MKYINLCLAIGTFLSSVSSFSPKSTTSLCRLAFTVPSPSSSSSSTSHHATREKNFLMEEFCTADGDIINPYSTLKVDRHATRTEIRHSYRELSKKYHPDAVRFREIMPGKCDTLDEVRDEWERIKLSYEILSDKKMRLKYDRQSALNDPGKALGRVALDTVSWGVTGFAKGIFHIGKQAVSAAADAAAKKNGGDYGGEAIVKADKRNRRRKKERMVRHIVLQEPTTTHDRKPSIDDSLSGNNNLLPFDSQPHH